MRIAGRDKDLEHRRDVERLDEVDHRPGHPDRRRLRLLLDDRRQVILSGELGAHVDVVFAHAGADDRPVVIAPGGEQIVEINRLMRAMEIADADVNDAGAEIGAVIARRGDALGSRPSAAAESFTLIISFLFDCLRRFAITPFADRPGRSDARTPDAA